MSSQQKIINCPVDFHGIMDENMDIPIGILFKELDERSKEALDDWMWENTDCSREEWDMSKTQRYYYDQVFGNL
jgi:hypothetical protein